MTRLRYGVPYWLDRPGNGRAATYPRQHGTLRTDVVIVGGGFTGLAAAHTFSNAGVRVVVLERARVARGSAAASTALLMHEPDCPFMELSERYGITRSRALWRVSTKAVSDLIALARKLNCGLHTPRSLHVAADAASARELRREHEARRAAGIQEHWLSRAMLQRSSHVAGFGAIASKGNAVLDPYRTTFALGESARARGARVFEHSPALDIKPGRGSVTVTTPGGTVRARQAIIATGFATPEFRALQAQFTMATTYVIATARLNARTRARIGEGRVMFWDAKRPYHYFRWTDDGRVLFGGGDRPVPSTNAARRNALLEAASSLKQALTTVVPALGPIRISHAWDGLFATTPDGLPYIGPHRHYPGHLFALGYGGNGMTLGFLAGQVLLRHVLGRTLATDDLFCFDRLL